MKTPVVILSGTLMRYLLQFLCILMVNHVYGQVSAGHLTLAIAIAAPVFSVCTLGMRNTILTLKFELSLADYMNARKIASAFAVIPIVTISLFLEREAAFALLAVSSARFIEAALDVKQAFWIRDQNLKPYVASIVLYLLPGLAGLLIISQTEAPMPVLVAITLALPALAGNVIDRRRERTTKTPRAFARIARAGIPLGISFAVVSLISGIPQYFLVSEGFTDQAAVFAIYLYLFVGLEMVLNSVLQSHYFAWRSQKSDWSQLEKKILSTTLVTCFIVSVPAICTGYLLIPIVFGQSFQITALQAVILGACALGIGLSFSASGIVNISNQYSVGLPVSFLAVSIVLILNLTHTFGYGLHAAFLTLAATQLLRGSIYLTLAHRRAKKLLS